MARSFFFHSDYPLCLRLRSLFILKIMHSRTLIKNAILVNEGQQSIGSLVIDGDRIEEILLGADAMPQLPPDTVIDAEGCYLLPGVIDEHVHFRDPGLTAKGDFHSESRAAAAGGVTTVIDMPNTVPPTVTKERLLQKIEIAEQQSLVNFGFFLGATPDNAERLRAPTSTNFATSCPTSWPASSSSWAAAPVSCRWKTVPRSAPSLSKADFPSWCTVKIRP